MRRRVGALVAAMLLATSVDAAPPRQVRVSVDFRQTGTIDRDTVEGGGGIVIRRHGRSSIGGALGGDSGTTRVRRTSGIFTLVMDGGDSMLSVQRRVPVEEVRFYQSYVTGGGYLARGIVFESVGTSLKVHADVIDERRVRLRLVPSVSYFGADGSGTIDLVDAATELEVESGVPVTIGGGTADSDEVFSHLFGYAARRERGESTVTLTAVVQ